MSNHFVLLDRFPFTYLQVSFSLIDINEVRGLRSSVDTKVKTIAYVSTFRVRFGF